VPQSRQGAGSAAPRGARQPLASSDGWSSSSITYGIVRIGQNLAVRDRMKTKRWVAVLVALVLMPAVLLWGAVLLIPAALLLVPCVLLLAIAAVPALLVAATSTRHDTARPQAPVSTRPIFTSS
jgi:hypothetical protein